MAIVYLGTKRGYENLKALLKNWGKIHCNSFRHPIRITTVRAFQINLIADEPTIWRTGFCCKVIIAEVINWGTNETYPKQE